MSKGKDLDDVPGGSGRDKRPRVGELVDMVEMPAKKWKKVRPVGQAFSYGTHWVKTKKRDGGETAFPTPCIAFDPETGRRDSTKPCAWCRSKSDKISFRVDNFINVIDRIAQKRAPDPEDNQPTKMERKTGFKAKDSETYTIYRVMSIPPSLVNKMKEAKQLNTHEDENGDTVAYGISHNKFGRDVNVMYDGDKSGTDKYQMLLGDVKPWLKSERAYLQWDLSDLIQNPSEEEVEEEYKSWASRNLGDEEDDDEAPKKTKKKARDADDDLDDDDAPKKTKKKKKTRDDDDDLDDDDFAPVKKTKKKARDDDDEDVSLDDDDDDAPKKPKKKASRDEDFDEDEDEPPKKKRKPADDDDNADDDPPPKKKRKPADDDFDEDEDAAPPKKKRKPADEDFDEDEDEPPPKKKRKPADEDEPPPKKKRKPADDDLDDDDDKPVKKDVKKKRSSDDDFDDL